MHAITAPNWTPSGLITSSHSPWALALVLTFMGLAVAGVILTVVFTHVFNKWPLWALLLIVVGSLGAGGAAGAFLIVNTNAEHAHAAQVASWLHSEYGATVHTSDLLHMGTDTVLEIPATINGTDRVLNLSRTGDGHIAVFEEVQRPLRAHR